MMIECDLALTNSSSIETCVVDPATTMCVLAFLFLNGFYLISAFLFLRDLV